MARADFFNSLLVLRQRHVLSRLHELADRHTYAAFRLTEGVDVYFLAKQMGTSVKIIEDHYGHVTPVKNADRILLGLPGWQSDPEIPAAAE